MPYAMSVIISRAIPEMDGFKPAHRKLLYTMYQMGLLTGSRIKSANVVGQTMRLNPHGDQAIYETLVRLTRGNDALLHPFIDSKGNFGKQYSRDMAYAASRYTEVKLDLICVELFKDIDKDAVDMMDNYDGKLKEPLLFPTTFPNLLVTPNQGIAVSMASSVCSFNLKEVCEATIHFMKDKDFTLSRYLLAPDFSTGGQLIYDAAEMEAIYATGRGGFKVKAKYHFDSQNNCVEITEIPYTTTIEAIIDKIVQLIRANKIREVSDVRDETDLNGLRITLDVKKNCDPDHLMRRLFSLTPLCDTFNCNFNFLVASTPKIMGVTEILTEWVRFRTICVRRQIRFDIEKKTEKAHLLDGLSRILLDIDKAIRIIRQTKEDSQVIPNLMSGFQIDQTQAEFIAEIRLRHLNQEYILNRVDELDSLRRDLEELNAIHGSDEKIHDLICQQLREIIKKYGKPRRTEIITEEPCPDVSGEEFIEEYNVKLFLTAHQYFKKVSLASLRSSSDQKLKEGDSIARELETSNKSEALFFSDKRNVYKAKVYELADCKASSLGEYLANLLGLEENERIVLMTAVSAYTGYMFFMFENGKAAKVSMEAYATKMNRKKLINAYSDKAPLLYADRIEADADYMVVRGNGRAILLNSALIAVSASRNAAGIQILTPRKNAPVQKICPAAQFITDHLEYFRIEKLPAAGHFLTDKEKAENGL
ncbi:MAG: topoisomerase IV [Clostridiales bacterium]|nr:topoisomerase IV [Clostridiales bacterium]